MASILQNGDDTMTWRTVLEGEGLQHHILKGPVWMDQSTAGPSAPVKKIQWFAEAHVAWDDTNVLGWFVFHREYYRDFETNWPILYVKTMIVVCGEADTLLATTTRLFSVLKMPKSLPFAPSNRLILDRCLSYTPRKTVLMSKVCWLWGLTSAQKNYGID